ncbi:hypothetical protein IWQ61_001912 [Dispira simplex]|nr:hypothetical protein IWQ61_001912 [Dispira simplex]
MRSLNYWTAALSTPPTGVRLTLTRATPFRLLTQWAARHNANSGSEGAKTSPDTPTEEAATTDTTETKPKKKLTRPSDRWLYNQDGYRFCEPKMGQTNYLGKRYPFPMNPFFQPRPPTPDALREEIYKKWTEAPAKYTPRKLAQTFRLAICRIEAILKLKILEKRMVENKLPLQRDFNRNMEGLLGVSPFTPGKPWNPPGSQEPPVPFVPEVGAPRFRAVDEEQTFTAEQAAQDLQRDVYVPLKAAGADAPFAFENKVELLKAEKTKTDHKVLGKNPVLANLRWDFMITDTNPKIPTRERVVVVRQSDGTLRQATSLERSYRIRALWPKETAHLPRV